jgi:hypothetical protein
VMLQVEPDHLCTPVVPHGNEDLEYHRQWKHGDLPTIDNNLVQVVEVRRSENSSAPCDHLYLNQYLDLNIFYDGHGPASCPNVATIPYRLVLRDGITQPSNQFRCCGTIS